MRYKLLAVDMDGTLLNDASIVTQRTREAVLAAMEKGVLFVPSTGRPMYGMDSVHAMFPGDFPYILFNGALAVTGETRQVLFSRGLGYGCAKEIYELGMARDIPVVLWADNRLYVSRDCVATREYQDITKAEMRMIDDFHDVTKMLWLASPAQALRWQEEMIAHFSGRVNCHTSRPELLEFVDAGASKGLALAEVGKAYGIAREEMIAVGDGWNDVSMLEYAGLGVAMGNAPEDIKRTCQEVTLGNNEDGVARVIEKYILEG